MPKPENTSLDLITSLTFTYEVRDFRDIEHRNISGSFELKNVIILKA